MSKRYPYSTSKNTDCLVTKKTRQSLWYKNSLCIELPVNKNEGKSDQKRHTGDLFKPPVNFWEQFTIRSKFPLPLTVFICSCTANCTFHLGYQLQLFSATNTFSLHRHGCIYCLTSTPQSIFQPIVQFSFHSLHHLQNLQTSVF